jgi:hypothetical protein
VLARSYHWGMHVKVCIESTWEKGLSKCDLGSVIPCQSGLKRGISLPKRCSRFDLCFQGLLMEGLGRRFVASRSAVA